MGLFWAALKQLSFLLLGGQGYLCSWLHHCNDDPGSRPVRRAGQVITGFEVPSPAVVAWLVS